MPSKAAFTTNGAAAAGQAAITGRCYCGKTTIAAPDLPLVTTYCHCNSCRRLTGAPVSAFCAFARGALDIHPAPHHAAPVSEGVERWFCAGCGSALAAVYDYLPDQVYVPIGIIDQADQITPSLHSHMQSALGWLHIDDDLPRSDSSGRDALNASRTP